MGKHDFARTDEISPDVLSRETGLKVSTVHQKRVGPRQLIAVPGGALSRALVHHTF